MSLRNTYSVGLSVADVTYRFPFKLLLEDVRITGEGMPMSVSVRVITLRPKLIRENIVIIGQGIRIMDDNVELKGASFKIASKLRLLKLRDEISLSLIESLNISIDSVKMERVRLSGFEFSSFTIYQFILSLIREGEELKIAKGFCRSDLFTSEITGLLTSSEVDFIFTIKLTELFFESYSNLSGLVESLTEDETIRFSIKGDSRRPTLNIESKRGV